MMKIFDWIIEHADKLTAFALLIIVCAALVWVARRLHEQERNCQKLRTEELKERANDREKLGKLAGKIETLESLNYQALMETIRSSNDRHT